MIVSLARFHYFFSLTGSRGGLWSMDCDFELRAEGPEDAAGAVGAVRDLMRTHTDMFDRLFDDVMRGKREPTLIDTPHSASTGYEYRGTLASWSAKRLERYLAEMFGNGAVDPRGGRSRTREQSVSIEFSARKRGDALGDASVKTKYQLDHMLNVCFFRFVAGLRDVAVLPEARTGLESLDRTLASDWDRTGRDHYRAMIARD